MRALLVHDHRFLRGTENGAVHTVGSFPRSVWQRYLAHFEQLTVVGRDGGQVPRDSDLARSDLPSVRFELIRNFSLSERLLGLRGEAAETIAREVAQADAVIVRIPSDLGNLAAQIAQAQGRVWAAEAVGCAADGYRNHGSRLSRLYAPVAARRMRGIAYAAPQILYVTRRFLQGRYPPGGLTVGVSDVEIVSLTAAERTRRAERLARIATGHAPVAGTVASLRTMAKGIQDVIAALAQLREAGLRVDYRVLGAGEREPWIRRAAAAGILDQVHFDGSRASGAGVRDWLDGIDLHLQPSYQEGLPRATVEAMSRGCACLGSTVGGLPELLPAERLHAPGDVGRLAAMIRALISNPSALVAASAADLLASEAYLPSALDPVREAFYAGVAERARAARS